MAQRVCFGEPRDDSGAALPRSLVRQLRVPER